MKHVLVVVGPLAKEAIQNFTEGRATSTEAGRWNDGNWLFLTENGSPAPLEQHVLAETVGQPFGLIAGEATEPDHSKMMSCLGISRFWKVDTESREDIATLTDPEAMAAMRAEIEAQITTDDSKNWTLPIQKIFRVRGEGVIFNGTVHGNGLRIGAKATLLPAGKLLTVRGVRLHGEDVRSADDSDRVSVAILGTDQSDHPAGSVLTTQPEFFQVAQQAELAFKAVARVRAGQRVRVSLAGGEVVGTVVSVDKESLILRFDEPVSLHVDQRVVLRRYSPTTLLGGGWVKKFAGTVFSGTLTDAIYAAVSTQACGLDVEAICELVNKSPQQLGDAFQDLRSQGKLLGFGGLWICPDDFELGVRKLLATLEHAHRTAPKRGAIPREKAMHMAGLTWAGKGLDRVLAELVERGEIAVDGNAIRLPNFIPDLSARQRRFLDRILEELDRAPVETPGVHELAAILGVPPPAIEEIIRVGIDRGEIVAVGGMILYRPAQLEALVERIRRETGKRKPAATVIRDTLGTTRKYALPLAEYLEE